MPQTSDIFWNSTTALLQLAPTATPKPSVGFAVMFLCTRRETNFMRVAMLRGQRLGSQTEEADEVTARKQKVISL